MKDRANDILVDYEGLCGQLTDVLEVLYFATAGHARLAEEAGQKKEEDPQIKFLNKRY